MPRELTIRIHCITADGYPDMDKLVGRVAFLFNGTIVSGWPLLKADFERVGARWPNDCEDGDWEANSDVGKHTPYRGVTHWVEFPEPLITLER